jgi:MFS superfamily sulfate permease-like transporter
MMFTNADLRASISGSRFDTLIAREAEVRLVGVGCRQLARLPKLTHPLRRKVRAVARPGICQSSRARDLGTLIPFVLAYISVMKLDPLGVLLGFGVCMVVSGFWYRTPFPVQPMKALGAVATTQAAQTAIIAPHAVYSAGLVTGIIWLVLGITGTTRWITHFVSRPVVVGIVLGLGLGFMLEGIKLMAHSWLLSATVLFVALLLLSSRRFPAMFALLIGGAVLAFIRDPALLDTVRNVRFEARLPSFALAGLTWSDFVIGLVFLAIPQVPLTLGNAMMAIVEENNRLFPTSPSPSDLSQSRPDL